MTDKLLKISQRLIKWDSDFPPNCWNGYAGLKELDAIIADAKVAVHEAGASYEDDLGNHPAPQSRARASNMPTETTEETKMTEDQIKHMVNRFLGWKLPDNFNPDGGISFRKMFNEHTDHPMKHEPSGTNLLDAAQAEAMVRHMLEGIPSPQPNLRGNDDAPLTVSFPVHEIAHNLLLAHTGSEGGTPTIDWYRLRAEISDAIAVALDDQRKLDTLPARQLAGLPFGSHGSATAMFDVIAERLRQQEQEGWTPGHDDAHSDGELARAASCYAYFGSWQVHDRQKMERKLPMNWPWERSWWKPTTARRDLVKAAALIIAEIERLDRAALASEGPA